MNRVVIIGGGIAGLTAARAITVARPEWDVTVLEAADRPGGKMITTVAGGYTFEHASTGLLAHRPETRTLIADLGLEERVTPATEAARQRFLYARGSLLSVPGSLGAALRTPILSPLGKLRVLAEPVAGRRRAAQDESVHDFAARHFGQEFARVVAQTALLGVGAGDARQTGLRAVFPRLHAIESTTGPLGLLGLALRSGRGRGPAAVMATFRDGGLNVLPDKLATVLGGRVRLTTEAREVRQGLRHRYEVVVDDGAVLEADTVIIAVPADAAAALLRNLVPGASARLSELPYTGVRVLGLGYDMSQLTRPFGGFGFLVSPDEDLRVLAVVASSNLFPGQAPQGRILLRVFLGGWQEPGLAGCALPEALRVAEDALRRTLGITGAPSFVADAPWPAGIPSYGTGHLAWLDDLDEQLAGHPRLYLTGSAYRGLGIDDTIREAAALAARVIETDTARQEATT